jgi:hypothetical protein
MSSRRIALAVGLAVALGSLACAGPKRLGWPADVRAAASRGPRIRPPEGWTGTAAAEAFHARGWGVLRESWSTEPSLAPAGHCFVGTVRPPLDETGDVVLSDLTEHGLEGARAGEATTIEGLEVSFDHRSLTVCEPDARVDAAVRGLAGECAAFGRVVAVLDDAIAEPALVASLSMDAQRLRFEVRWDATSLPMDRLLRSLAELGLRGEMVGPRTSPPRMQRVDDAWEVSVDLPAEGERRVVLRAVTELPRRTLCGPPPLPPIARGS